MDITKFLPPRNIQATGNNQVQMKLSSGGTTTYKPSGFSN